LNGILPEADIVKELERVAKVTFFSVVLSLLSSIRTGEN
jgi:hypothetical protein